MRRTFRTQTPGGRVLIWSGAGQTTGRLVAERRVYLGPQLRSASQTLVLFVIRSAHCKRVGSLTGRGPCPGGYVAPRSTATGHYDGTVENKKTIKWRSRPQKHDYAAAASYLSLVYGHQAAENAARELESAAMSKFFAKDIFRASMLSLLGVSNSHVERDRAKINSGQKLSPILLFRDKRNGKVIVADGYHRLCAVYTFDENAMIPCKIAGPD